MSEKEIIPYGRHKILKNDIDSVVKVLNSDYLTQGPKIEEFENKIANTIGSKFCIATNSATSALHIACLSIGLEKNDILWTSSITFVASANVGRFCGANVDFVEIDPETGLMCVKALEKKLDKASKINKLPKIVMPVHLAGSSCDLEVIYKLSKIYNFKIIEDASHAIGGSYQNTKVGSCKFSDITVFSFHPVKIITTGEGGVATTNNSNLAKRMRMFSNHGITKDKSLFVGNNKNSWIYEQQLLGYNYRITDIQCALGISQLNRLSEIVQKRNILFNNYKNLIKNYPINLLSIPENVRSSVHLAVILIKNCNSNQHKNIFEYLKQNKIGVQLHYYPVHLQPYYKAQGFHEGYLPLSEKYAETAISIPLYPELEFAQQVMIVEIIKNALAKFL